MNEYAERFQMTSTCFDSPHGLMNIQNISSAHDIAKLSAICMKHSIFRDVVKTKYYECFGKSKYDIGTECYEER